MTESPKEEWLEPRWKDYILYGPIYMKFPTKANLKSGWVRMCGNKAAEVEAGIGHREARGDFFGMMDKSLKLGIIL